MPDILDVFNGDGFDVVSLSGLVSQEPYAPGQIGALGLFDEEPVTTTTVAFDMVDGVLTLVGPTPRGGPGETVGKLRGTMRSIAVPHFQRDDAIMADEVQGRRQLGTTQRQDFQGLVVRRSMRHFRDFDTTLEHQRMGALSGIVLDKNGNTMYNLFNEFGVTQESTVDFDLDNANLVDGAIRSQCDEIIETIENNLGADTYDHIHAICGRSFYRSLWTAAEVRKTFLNTTEAQMLRSGMPRTFDFGNVLFERYRTGGNSGFIGDDEVRIFPAGVNGLYSTYFAPADYIETVNTPGLPRYVKLVPMRNDKGIGMEVQSNPLSVCKKPKVLMKGVTSA